jgi:hypothetical protein
MRSLIMLILMAVGLVFLITQVTPVRVEYRQRDVDSRYERQYRPTQPRPMIQTVKSGTTERPIHEIKVIGKAKVGRDEAYEDALEQAAHDIEKYFALQYSLDLNDVKRLVRCPEEKIVRTGEFGDTRKYELTLQFDDAFVNELVQIERESRMRGRMQILARGLAVAVAALFAIAGYVRLDEWSKGYYSGLLKAVAVLAVAGIGLVAWMR